MDYSKGVSAARDQLALVLGFFPRVDAKLSVVLGIDIAMLGYMASKVPPWSSIGQSAWIALGTTTVLLVASLWHLYQGSFPNLEGGGGSLVYFGEIAKRTEARFIEEYRALTEEGLAKDLLGQAWRNSEILRQKFSHLVWAYRFMGLASFAWASALVLLQ